MVHGAAMIVPAESFDPTATLDAIERAGRVIEFEPSRDVGPALGLLSAAAALLRRASGELRVGGTRSVLGTAEYHRFALARALAQDADAGQSAHLPDTWPLANARYRPALAGDLRQRPDSRVAGVVAGR